MNVSDDPKLVLKARIAIAVLLFCAVFVFVALPKVPLPARIAIAVIDILAALALFVMTRQRTKR